MPTQFTVDTMEDFLQKAIGIKCIQLGTALGEVVHCTCLSTKWLYMDETIWLMKGENGTVSHLPSGDLGNSFQTLF